ncbi:sugar ABC transporter ATP-binding protein [Thalassospira sp. UBA1131]|uniref:sugar ABC transporter ATP-binding protein n=1 Tax=Thalassospira sp. UBA1131 TaxID=1947672 RepID=UPI0025FD036D|nr:sugar ABC transporter ATP-binding protein [Thalassospira sp. UBA1131]
MTELDHQNRCFLELRNIHKRFGGVHALRGVDMSLNAGEVYHLLGENGCGKSTVIKIMAGAHPPSEGEIILDGKAHKELTPIQSLDFGIETVYQDLSLIPNLTVMENVALSEQLVESHGSLMSKLDRPRLKETATRALSQVGLPVNHELLGSIVSELPLAIRQLIAIARAIACEARLVIMDEPTTSLTRREVENLIAVVSRLRAQHVAVLFVTHKLEECYRIGGNAIVFRDGECVAQGPIESYTRADLAELMTGRQISEKRYRKAAPSQNTLLSITGLSVPGRFNDVTFKLNKGEVLGITGLSDSGRNELALAIAGIRPAENGTIEVGGKPVSIRSSSESISAGIGYVPEDRLSEGLFLNKSIYQNEIALILRKLAGKLGILDMQKGKQIARDISENMRLNTADIELPVSALSGGNQQRVLIGRWLSINPEILVLHGPTVGVDVGSKDAIYQTIQTMAEDGMGLVIVSDDLPELLQNCDRILVMNAGDVIAELDGASTNEDEIYQAMLGSVQEGAA